MTVTLFIPCFVDVCYPQVGLSVVRILERLGHDVAFAENLTCCGQPPFNAGFWDEARSIAARVIEGLAGAEVVVVPSGSCTATIKNFYPEMFAGSRLEPVARELANKTFEFSDFLVNRLSVTDLGARFPARVTYHDGCHNLRELGRKQEPRTLLSHVRDLELIEMGEAETCCGFGGTFAVKFPAISTAMAEVKCESAGDTGAQYVVSTDSSCLMQIQGLLDRQRSPMRTIHLAEILARRE
ncbi:MAG: (Fe-S)-binding protein [Anaerolineae bacterium]|nr:(Fe-S)-binding protein [Phycisphaerae bacterium]